MPSRSKPVPLRSKVLWAAIVLWLGLVFGHYFQLKNAFDLSFLQAFFSDLSHADFHKFAGNWLHFLKVFLWATGVVFTQWRMGRRFSGWAGLNGTNIVLKFCLDTALGILLLNAVWLGLGFNGLWYEPLLTVLLIGLLAFALWDVRVNFLKIQRFPKLVLPGKFFLWVGLLGLLGFALDLFQGMVPDVYYDALVYHLSTLQFWMLHHGVADFYTNLYSYFPFGGELYFFNGFVLGGSEGAKLLNEFAAGLCGLAVAGWVGEETAWDMGLVAWTMVLTLPLVSATVWTTQNDVLLAFFMVLFIYSLVRWMEEDGKGNWALWAGLMGGAALAIKYTAFISAIAVLLALAVVFRKEVFKVQRQKGWLLVLAVLTLSIAPWLLKNAYFTGNGFYPYLSSWFGGWSLPDINMRYLMGDQEAGFPGRFSLADWALQVLGKDLDKTVAPLLFGFLPFLFLGGIRSRRTKFLLIAGALLLAAGFLTSHQLRLLIPVFAVFFLAITMVVGGIENKTAASIWGWTVGLFAVLCLLSLCRLSMNYYQSQKMWLGEQTREEYLDQSPQTSSYFELSQAVDRFLPASGRILIVGDARCLYYPGPFLANSAFDDQVLPRLVLKENDDPDRIRKRLREMGIDAIVVCGTEGRRLAEQKNYFFSSETWALLDDFVQRWADPVFINGLNGIYSLRTAPAENRQPIPVLFWE